VRLRRAAAALASAAASGSAAARLARSTKLIDPMTEDFFAATAGHDPIISFSTIPVWLFRTPKPVDYPADPNEVTWTYSQGTELIEGGLARMADYFARLVAWCTRAPRRRLRRRRSAG
jgi:hypothetical protein